MPAPFCIRHRLLLPAVAGSLFGTPVAGGQALTLSAPGPLTAAAVRAAPGVEIHYDLLTPAATSAGRLEGIVAGKRGELRTSVLVDPGAEGRLARLDTRWQTQLPGPWRTLVLGDTFGSGGGWSRPVRVGGLRLGRGLSLRPGFIAAPQAGLAGSAALPSAPMQLTGRPGAGNAAASHLPGPSLGAGEPAVALPAPLPAGEWDYELEAGRLRTGWSTADDHYGEGYAAAAYRTGLGAEFTAEARAEWTPSRTAAGLEMIRAFGPAGSVHAVLAKSDTAQASGLRWGMGLVHNIDGIAWRLSSDAFDRGFTPLGAAPGEADPRGRLQAGATLPLWSGANAELTYARESAWESPAAGLMGLTARFLLPERSSLSLNYSQRAGVQPGWQAGLTLSLPLGADRL